MTPSGLEHAVAARFAAFTDPYVSAPGDAFAFRLKIDHTLRVLGIAKAIVQAEKLPEHLALACHLAALMHDVGRFPQYRQYRTFRDTVSANHAGLSVRHALREKMLEGATVETRRLVLGAVYLHNKRTLPRLRSAGMDTVARVVRDSDKLDIYQVMIEHFSQKNPPHPEVALDVKDEPGAYSSKVIEAVLRRKPGDYEDIVYINDFKIMTIGWLYDLNFRASCRMLHERGYLETLFAGLPKDTLLNTLREHVRADLAQRLEGA
ncbi:MAG: HD domain-containing protein [Humidesulfovibrio sp.]|nr:HD domain-containing protein [Humidesulfovibrio sp.]